MTKQAICFRCKKKFRARKDQHPKYSLCPSCKDYKEEFGSGSSWIDRCRSDFFVYHKIKMRERDFHFRLDDFLKEGKS